MNNFFEWIFWFLKKWIFALNEYSGFLKNEYLFWMNILDFYKMNNFLNKHFGFTLPASIMVVAKCLKLIWNQSGIISRTYFSPFQGVYHLYSGLRKATKPYFGLILEFWIIFLIFCEWIILLNILDSIEWIFFWMNIPDFVLNWIIFRPDSMKKWIFKTDQPVVGGTPGTFRNTNVTFWNHRGYPQTWNLSRPSRPAVV